MSLGGGSPDVDTQSAVKYAVEKGVVVIAAAGNEGPGEQTVGYPGGYPEVVCVGAVDDKLNVARFSSRGKQLFVCAPGVNIRSCYPGDRFATMSGTSMATPYVAGIAALWIAANPDMPKVDRPAAFKKALIDTVIDLGPSGRDTAYGYGFGQPAKMLGKGGGDPMDPPMPPTPKPPTKIRFGLDDFTDSGKEKLKLLNPDLESIEFTLKPKE
jgi:subtilisin family serine protease